MAVAAIIVGTDESQISQTRSALSGQSSPVQEIKLATSLTDATALVDGQFEWIWLLAAGMEPQPTALASLSLAAETSPSAVWLAPKLVRSGRVRELEEFGLTVNRFWQPISPVRNELDQGQHDHREDLLAASVFGSLLRTDALLAAGGFAQRGNALANQYRLAVAMRLAGNRVLAAPAARVALPTDASHPPIQLSDFSPLQQSRAQVQLFTGYRNPVITLLGGLFAPLFAIFGALFFTAAKRPERIGVTLATGFWWFFNGFLLLGKRPRLGPGLRGGLGAIKTLFATREDRHRAAQSGIEHPAAIAEASLEAENQRVSFSRSGGYWIMLALAAVSWQFWPKDIAVSGGGLAPLGTSLAHLFSRAGASWQQLGFGVPAPSDPFNWVLFGFGLITFWAPTLSVTLFVFLIKPLAFGAAWRLLTLVSRRPWLLTVGALTYAFWPALTAAQAEGRLGTSVALVLLPLFLFTLARILQFGASPRRSVQTWTWVGTGALLAAAISAGAPSLTPLVGLVILLLAIYRFKRIGYLVWLPVPLLVMWIPLGWYLTVGLAHPMLLFTEPGVPNVSGPYSIAQLLLGTPTAGLFAQWVSYLPAVPLLLALGATVTKRALNGMWLWLALLASVATAFIFNQLVFFNGTGSPLPLVGLAGLIASVLLVIALDQAGRAGAAVGGALSLLVSVVFAAQFLLLPATLTWSDGSQMPALVRAQAAQNPNTRVLVIASSETTGNTTLISAQIVTGAGQVLPDHSVAYDAAIAKLRNTDARYSQLGDVVANLVAANDANLQAGLKKFAIDYVLLPAKGDAVAIGSSLDTVAQLEPVGTTQYGRLWRVRSSELSHAPSGWDWSVTKQVQVGVLALFALLALPTRRRSRISSDDEQELDAFEGGFESEAF
jgi:hypothetical protein